MIFFAKLGRKAQKQTLVDSHFHPDWFFTLFCGRSISVGKWFTDQQPRMEISRARAVLIPNRQNSISDPWPKGRRSAAVDQFTQLFPPSFEGIRVFATKLEGTHLVFFRSLYFGSCSFLSKRLFYWSLRWRSRSVAWRALRPIGWRMLNPGTHCGANDVCANNRGIFAYVVHKHAGNTG